MRNYLLLFFLLPIGIVSAQKMSVDDKIELMKILPLSQEIIPVIVQVNKEFNECDLKHLDIKINSRIDDVITMRIKPCQIENLIYFKWVDYIQIARKINPKLNRSIPDVRADSVYLGAGLKTPYTGKNVIIGITDWGFDYTHPMFYDTSMQQYRIIAAWDQFKTSGPAPSGFNFGTEYVGKTALLNAQSDTFNIYDYATHGSHVAGIAAGGGAGTSHRGVAFDAEYLMATFLVDESAVIDAFMWMKKKADELNKRLVINMSWGLHHFGTLDGTSLLSRAINSLSAKGVVFVSSGGNNGDVDFHIKKTFNGDTMKSLVEFYSYAAHNKMWGQSITAWGEKNNEFEIGFDVYNSSKNKLYQGEFYKHTSNVKYIDSFIVLGLDTVYFNLRMEKSNPYNQKPHARLRIKNKNTNLYIGLKSTANVGTVHYWNVTELTNDVGNWGMPFSAFIKGWTNGDNRYAISEPATTQSVITVAAHNYEFRRPNGIVTGGAIASFSSYGPTADGRMKPDVSAPGVNVSSSISSFTTNSYTLSQKVNFNGKDYPFARFSGTSMSSPTVAGVVALMLSANDRLSSEEVKKILIATAREDFNTGALSNNGDTMWGHGKVNAVAAVRMAEQMKKSNGLMVYPNPANNYLMLESSDSDEVTIELINVMGQILFIKTVKRGERISINTLESGVYYLRTNMGTKRVVIMNYD